MSSAQEFDVAVIGSGLAGLAAAHFALSRELSCCLIAGGLGATEHFSGAFDLIDPRWASPSEDRLWDTPLALALENFTRAHPGHLYSKLLRQGLKIETLLNEMKRFLKDCHMAHAGDGDWPVAVFGSTGRLKPAAFAMPTHACQHGELKKAEAVFVEFPFLQDYKAATIASHLRAHFSSVRVAPLTDWNVNASSPLAGLLQNFDQPETLAQFIKAIQPRLGNAKFLILPPVLGQKSHLENHSHLESELGVRVIELLSVLPSVAGLRLKESIRIKWSDPRLTVVHGHAGHPNAEAGRILSLMVRLKNAESGPARKVPTGVSTTTIRAKEYILATGKFLGGGIRHHGHFAETLFGLPLMSQGKKLTARTHVTQLITAQGMQRQGFLDVGVETGSQGRPVFQSQLSFTNLKACGHVLTGFDFARDRCGFGVSVASALACFL